MRSCVCQISIYMYSLWRGCPRVWYPWRPGLDFIKLCVCLCVWQQFILYIDGSYNVYNIVTLGSGILTYDVICRDAEAHKTVEGRVYTLCSALLLQGSFNRLSKNEKSMIFEVNFSIFLINFFTSSIPVTCLLSPSLSMLHQFFFNP